MNHNKLIKIIGSTAAAVALAFGAWALGSSGSSGSGSATASNANGLQRGGAPPGGALRGGRPGGPGFGAAATGTAAAKAGKAATARYPGTVEGVLKLQDSSYVVHVITSSGEVHVAVSKDFAVTGTQRGPGGPPPGAGGAGPPSGSTPPSGATPPAGASATS
jgi:hypothetical protein